MPLSSNTQKIPLQTDYFSGGPAALKVLPRTGRGRLAKGPEIFTLHPDHSLINFKTGAEMGKRDYRHREAKKPKRDAKRVTAAEVLPFSPTVTVIKRKKKSPEAEEE